MKSRPAERLAAAGAANSVTRGDAGCSGRLEYAGADRKQHRGAAGEVDLDVHFLSVSAARRDQLAVDAFRLEHVGGESQVEPGGERRRVTE